MKEQPNYYAIITADVRYDKRLTANAKLLFAEITSLCNKDGKCWATNKYFAELYGVSVTSVSKWISQLVEFGYIKSVIIYKEGTKEILNRYLSLVKEGIEEKLNTPIEEKLKENNTSIINNKINNKKELNISDFDFLLRFINEKTKRNFRTINNSVKAKYNARIREGYTLEDITSAIQNAVNNQYHIDSKNQYLTPEFFSRAEKIDKYSSISDLKEDKKLKGPNFITVF